ncbi:MAG: hypothetical protein EXR82_11470 [Gammaproteobacteria bacterium]|nr:hypothetical protein [Gammaproteobacteria bacterium]
MLVRVFLVVGALVALSGCAQFTTNAIDKATLKTVASKAGDDYVSCVVDAAGRYQQTGESASLIAEVAKKACTASRSEFITAENAWLKSEFMSTEPILQKDLAALDQRAELEVQQQQVQALERKVAAPPVAAAAIAPVASASVASVPAATSAPAAGSAYLKCMTAEGQRYAGVNEPATVVAEVAQSRCASLLTDPVSAAPLEQQGRALVMGLVLDRKVSAP